MHTARKLQGKHGKQSKEEQGGGGRGQARNNS
jgi:hypothetical protein